MVDLTGLGVSPALAETLLIVTLPILIVLGFFAIRPHHRPGRTRASGSIIFGIASLSLFYIFAPDPSVIYQLYALNGQLLVPFLFALVAAFFLLLAVFYFGTAASTRPRRSRR